MAAYNESFPWTSSQGHYEFFENRMDEHDKVASWTTQGKGVYELARTRGNALRIFICDCYAFGVAEYTETVKKLGKIDAVIINSVWCRYTPEAKQHCRHAKVGLFTIKEFMAALNRKDYWCYLTEDETRFFKESGKL